MLLKLLISLDLAFADQNFINFMHIFLEIWQNCILASRSPGGSAPPTENPYSWIHSLNWVATAQRKQGIWFLPFPDREITGNFALIERIVWRHMIF